METMSVEIFVGQRGKNKELTAEFERSRYFPSGAKGFEGRCGTFTGEEYT